MSRLKEIWMTDPTLALPLEGREFYFGLGRIVLSLKKKAS